MSKNQLVIPKFIAFLSINYMHSMLKSPVLTKYHHIRTPALTNFPNFPINESQGRPKDIIAVTVQSSINGNITEKIFTINDQNFKEFNLKHNALFWNDLFQGIITNQTDLLNTKQILGCPITTIET